MNVFEIEVSGAEGSYHVDAKWWPPGAVAAREVPSERLLKLPPALPVGSALSSDRLPYGVALSRSVFQGAIRDAFAAAQGAYPDRLHVALRIAASELNVCRWELLACPEERTFLRLNQALPYHIRITSNSPRSFARLTAQDLKALVAVSDLESKANSGLASFDAREFADSARESLGDMQTTTLACGRGERLAEASGMPTLDELCERFTDERPTILHLVCHGRLLPQGETALYLPSAAKRADPGSPAGKADEVTATRLIRRLAGIPRLPHLVFLCSCDSSASGGAVDGLAQRLADELGIPAVVAMTEPISIALADSFIRKFYRRLRLHGLVDVALAEASAGLADHPHVLVPNLYCRLSPPSLFAVAPPPDSVTKRNEMTDRNALKNFVAGLGKGGLSQIIMRLEAFGDVSPNAMKHEQLNQLWEFVTSNEGPGLEALAKVCRELWPDRAP